VQPNVACVCVVSAHEAHNLVCFIPLYRVLMNPLGIHNTSMSGPYSFLSVLFLFIGSLLIHLGSTVPECRVLVNSQSECFIPLYRVLMNPLGIHSTSMSSLLIQVVSVLFSLSGPYYSTWDSRYVCVESLYPHLGFIVDAINGT